MTLATSPDSPLHPLDPLTPTEITSVAAAIKASPEGSSLSDFIFNSISLNEPPKYEFLKYEAGEGPVPNREAAAVLIDRKGEVYEVVVSVDSGEVTCWKHIPNVQPPLTPQDCFDAEAIVRQSPKVLEMLKEHGITSMDMVVADPWSYGYHGEKDLEGRRLVQTFMYLKDGHAEDNHYARPLGFVPVVDIINRTIIKIDKQRGSPLHPPTAPQNYGTPFMAGKYRDAPKPLEIVQPEGPSFVVNGNEVEWQKWKFRVGFNYREGLVLYNVGYEDKGTVRPILYRAALAEMVVPYADPSPPFHRKAAFDVGDYGLGYCANSLTLGCDCLGLIKYFDGVMNDHAGNPFILKNAVCMHEEDAGVLWKHLEYRTGHAEVRRSRKLVVSFIATVVNYAYAFYWSFYQDGTIQYEIKATGELSTNVVESGVKPPYGTLVAPQINAQHHQHLFSMRIDPMVDGVKNAVSELEVEAVDEGPENPYGNAFRPTERVFKTELEAQRVANPLSGRYWKIFNPSSINPMSQTPVGFKLVSPATPLLLAKQGSYIGKRAAFATKHLWVTKYERSERFPAGEYINQAPGGQGLPLWTAANRPIYDEDIVVWHTFGVTHVPRVEDFPIMPVDVSGFMMKPLNFFTENPSVDVPPSVKSMSKLACCS
ncbi:hypothetical protein HK104_004806 [Borealophlyctis nickersoniae]|nr:hypothetical protein HK104_004806 [Borealophlyctis nickersoniae]